MKNAYLIRGALFINQRHAWGKQQLCFIATTRPLSCQLVCTAYAVSAGISRGAIDSCYAADTIAGTGIDRVIALVVGVMVYRNFGKVEQLVKKEVLELFRRYAL